MQVYRNIKTYPLRYADFDFKDDFRLSSLLALTQESACASADELGFGYSVLKPKRLGFLVTQTYAKLLRPVSLGSTLTVETWPLPPRHVIFERDYRVDDEKGPVALLASRWCLASLDTFSLCLPEALGDAHANCPYRDEHAVEVPAGKIPRLEEHAPLIRTATVELSRTDHYLHANNAEYADFFLDCFTQEELEKMQISAFRIAYIRQMKTGEQVSYFRVDGDGESTLEARTKEGVAARMQLFFSKR